MTSPSLVDWPADLTPDVCPVYTYNELWIDAPVESIWAWLIRAEQWPSWYANCKRLRFMDGGGPDLAASSDFAWWTFGVPVRTRVHAFEPHAVLAWRGGALGSAGYHAWVLQPGDGGCRVVTEETQRGLIPWVGRWYLRAGLLRWHQRWLEGLAERARCGPPPS